MPKPRDRFLELKQIREGTSNNDEEIEPLKTEHSESVEIERMDEDMSSFLEKVEETRTMIEELKSICAVVQRNCREVLNSPFQQEDQKKKIDDLMASVQTASRDIRKNLSDIETAISKNEQNYSKVGGQPAALRIQKTQHLSLAREFISTINDYQVESANYRDTYLASIQTRLQISGLDISATEVEDLMNKGNWTVFTQGLLVESINATQEFHQIEERYTFLINLEESTKELNQLFFDLAQLVQSQGEMIDRIEDEVLGTADYVQIANKELQEAEKKKSTNRKCKIYGMIAVILIISAIVLIIFFSF